MAPARPLITVSGGAVGSDPWADRSWSGSSRRFLTELQESGRLRSALGVKARPWELGLCLATNFSLDRQVWRDRLYLDVRLRDFLTKSLRRQLATEGSDYDLLQFAGYYDGPLAAPPGVSRFAYYDGTLALRMNSSHGFRSVSARKIDEANQYEAKLASELDLIFTMSEHVRQSFIRDYGVEPERVVVVGGGHNLNRPISRRPWHRVVAGQVLFVGVDFERKGGWDVLHAFRACRERIPHATLHIVGPKSLDIPRDLSAGVTNHGYLQRSSAEFEELFQTSELFVMPSRHEAFGIAPLEAMLYEIPAIVTGEWALGEMVIPGYTGWHVPPGNVQALERSIEDALRDRSELRNMGRKAQDHVRTNYTWKSVVRRMTSAIDAYHENNGGGRPAINEGRL